MKKKEIPEFVFKKHYDYYFLFTEYDIVFNEIFYSKFDFFLSELESKKINICLQDIPEHINNENFKREYNYTLPNFEVLKTFHESEVNNVPIYNINHFITDNTLNWEIFISIENELSIFGINKNLIKKFNQIYKPYKDESLEVKVSVIGGQFVDENYKKQFIEQLIKNYSLNNW